MGNCLKTQLKETVQNDNLLKLGSFVIKVTKADSLANSNMQRLNLVGYNFDIKATGNGYFAETVEELTTNPKTSLHVTEGDQVIYVANETFDLVIENKYGLVRLRNSDGGSIYQITAESLNYAPLKEIQANYILHGDISNFRKNSPLEILKITGIGISGDIKLLSDLRNLNTLNIVNCRNINGEIRELADGMVSGSNPRTSGTLTITSNGIITLDGIAVELNTNKVITFDSSLHNGYSIN